MGSSRGTIDEASRRLHAVFEAAQEGICGLDEQGRIRFANTTLAGMLGRTTDELIGEPLRRFLVSSNGNGVASARSPGILLEKIAEHDIPFRGGGGESVWTRVAHTRLDVPDSEGVEVIATFVDVTRERRFQRDSERLAMYDPLTGLPNRALLEDRLEHVLKRRTRLSKPAAFLIVELDAFRRINDTFGHPIGDALLTMVGQRIRDRTRPDDTVARMGGDEFGVLLEGIDGVEDVEIVAQRLTQAFDEPYVIMERPVQVTASIGIAVNTSGSNAARDLMRFADVAMYRAKEDAGTSFRVFDPSRDFDATRRVHLETELSDAIETGHLQLYYQPIVELRSRTIVGAEALVRWIHPTRGVIYPGEFIALAEETGLIVQLGSWVLSRAARDLVGWRGSGAVSDDFVLSVNVSGRQLGPELLEDIEALLTKHDLPAGSFQLELTETTVLGTAPVVPALRERGVRLAIDDVGTGHGSLEQLVRLEVDALKIDRAFVGGLGSTSRDTAVVEAVLLLADHFSVSAVAEGIETEDQLARLVSLGCEYGQGYYFARPGPVKAFRRLLGHTLPTAEAMEPAD